MEPSYTLTHSELIEVFKRWDIKHLKSYPDAKIKDPEKDSAGQANEFVRLLNEVKK